MSRRSLSVLLCLALVYAGAAAPAGGYVLNRTIGTSGGCPELDRFNVSKTIDRRWNASPSSAIRTTLGTWTGTTQESEVLASINRSFDAWVGVAGTTLPGKLGLLARTTGSSACSFTDGRNTICFNQSDTVFNQTAGVLAFTRVVSAERVGEPLGTKTAGFVGEILDADVYFRPSGATFATPGALTSSHFDLESVLTHELGHFFGFSHSSVWRAMMWPFAPPPGRFTGERPTAQRPDGPLADDDRTGLRILYPDAADTVNVGTIRGRVLPANPIALATLPPPSPGRSVTGIFGAHVVAIDADTGAVVAGTFAGWTCSSSDLPTRFDGSYVLERLPLGRNYKIFAEPVDGPTSAGDISIFLDSLCRSGSNNACTPPGVNSSFTTRVLP
jgi:hypothetical protein